MSLVSSTSFFRDEALFAHLRDQTLPELLARARRGTGVLRLWSAGCATGEEAYSLAMLVADALATDRGTIDARIFATDVDPGAIRAARKGVYSAEAVASVPADLRARHLTADDGHFAVRNHVRNLLIFGEHDLTSRPAFPKIDLVLCRNVLPSFSAEQRSCVLQLFAFALKEGGYLALGASDTLDPSEDHFEPREPLLKVYRRGSVRATTPRLSARAGAPGQPQPSRLAAPSPRGNVRPAQPAHHHASASPDRLAQVFARLATGVVVVDRDRRVRVINSAACRALGVSKDAAGRRIADVARHAAPSRLLDLLDAVFEGRGPARIEELELADAAGSTPRYLSITASALRETDAPEIDAVVLRLEDVTTIVESHRLVGEPGQVTSTGRHLGHASRIPAHRGHESPLEMEGLVAENKRMREANEQMVAANARTVEDNERLLRRAAEAEMDAAEVGVLNRELGVTVHELEALNEALGATMEELRTTNEDLEAQRVRLDAVLAGLSDALVVVDRGARAVLFNAAYERLFAAPQSRLRLRDAEGRMLPAGETPWQRAARGEPFVQEFSVATENGERRFEAVGKALRVGVEPEEVVVLRDVTDRSPVTIEEELFKQTSHELRTPLTSLQGSLDRIARLLPPSADERIKNYAAIAAAQTHQLTRLSADLLDAARLRAGSLEIWRTRVDLAALVRRAVDSIRPLALAQQLGVDASDEPLEVDGDPERIEQVVMNLLVNAISHAPDSDRIDVRLRRCDAVAELAVQDYGEGIPPDLVPHLFTRVARAQGTPRRKGSGLGLGLYLSKEIVEAHGGTISVESRPGHGATFTVRLPAREEPAA